ncbi:hypothetical protein EV426DRAFT_306355 [Tirmania nivea]|nr:hypothetical protein EV426DRAFT_306355 [Tirmania nivea]
MFVCLWPAVLCSKFIFGGCSTSESHRCCFAPTSRSLPTHAHRPLHTLHTALPIYPYHDWYPPLTLSNSNFPRQRHCPLLGPIITSSTAPLLTSSHPRASQTKAASTPLPSPRQLAPDTHIISPPFNLPSQTPTGYFN